eukprot:351171-Chlamydomonas_euryale.AAC.4
MLTSYQVSVICTRARPRSGHCAPGRQRKQEKERLGVRHRVQNEELGGSGGRGREQRERWEGAAGLIRAMASPDAERQVGAVTPECFESQVTTRARLLLKPARPKIGKRTWGATCTSRVIASQRCMRDAAHALFKALHGFHTFEAHRGLDHPKSPVVRTPRCGKHTIPRRME